MIRYKKKNVYKEKGQSDSWDIKLQLLHSCSTKLSAAVRERGNMRLERVKKERKGGRKCSCVVTISGGPVCCSVQSLPLQRSVSRNRRHRSQYSTESMWKSWMKTGTVTVVMVSDHYNLQLPLYHQVHISLCVFALKRQRRVSFRRDRLHNKDVLYFTKRLLFNTETKCKVQVSINNIGMGLHSI